MDKALSLEPAPPKLGLRVLVPIVTTDVPSVLLKPKVPSMYTLPSTFRFESKSTLPVALRVPAT